MLALLPVLVPALMKAAEFIFPKKDGQQTGSSKREFVIAQISALWDAAKLSEKLNFSEKIDEKAYFLDLVDLHIKHFLPSMNS